MLQCLLRLARDDGRSIEEAELRALSPMPETGMTVAAFAQAARRLGFAVRRIPYDAGAAAQLPTPFVILCAADVGALLVTRRDSDALSLFRPVDGSVRGVPPAETVTMAREALALTRADPILPAHGWRSLIAQRVKRVAVELGAIPVFVGLSLAVHHRQKRLIDENFVALAAKTSALAETVANTLTVKSLAPEGEMGKGKNRLALTPGMQVDVDLLIGHRSILSYLTERLSRARQSAFTER